MSYICNNIQPLLSHVDGFPVKCRMQTVWVISNRWSVEYCCRIGIG